LRTSTSTTTVRRARTALAFAFVMVLALAAAPVARAADPTTQWPQFGQNAAHLGTSPSDDPQPPLRQKWKFDMPEGDIGLSAPIVAEDTVIALSRRAVYGVDLATGEQRWRVPRNGGSLLATPAVAVAETTPVLLFTQGSSPDFARLVAYSLEDPDAPALLWQVPLRDTTTTGITVDGSTAFVADESGNVMAVDVVPDVRHVDADRDLVRWEHTVPGVVPSPPAVGGGTVAVVARSRSTSTIEVVALSEDSGKERWTAASDSQASTATSVTIDGERAFVGLAEPTGTGALMALGLDDGGVRWSTRVASPFLPFTNIPLADGHLLALATRLGVEAGLYRVEAQNGRRVTTFAFGKDGLWSFEFDASSVFASPVVIGDAVVMGFDDGDMAAVDVTSGNVVWRTNIGERPIRGVTAADGVVAATIGSKEGGIVAFQHDPDGPLLDETSPSRPEWSEMLLNYAIAFAAIGVVATVVGFAVRPRRARTTPRTGDGEPDADDALETEPEGESE
jgi:outer membrane protein assembly factor BamB